MPIDTEHQTLLQWYYETDATRQQVREILVTYRSEKATRNGYTIEPDPIFWWKGIKVTCANGSIYHFDRQSTEFPTRYSWS